MRCNKLSDQNHLEFFTPMIKIYQSCSWIKNKTKLFGAGKQTRKISLQFECEKFSKWPM